MTGPVGETSDGQESSATRPGLEPPLGKQALHHGQPWVETARLAPRCPPSISEWKSHSTDKETEARGPRSQGWWRSPGLSPGLLALGPALLLVTSFAFSFSS